MNKIIGRISFISFTGTTILKIFIESIVIDKLWLISLVVLIFCLLNGVSNEKAKVDKAHNKTFEDRIQEMKNKQNLKT